MVMNREWLIRRQQELEPIDPEAAEQLGWFLQDTEPVGDNSLLRSGELGQFDLYYHLLYSGFGAERSSAIVELSLDKIRQEENADEARRNDFFTTCINRN